jgi:hypothetical protein
MERWRSSLAVRMASSSVAEPVREAGSQADPLLTLPPQNESTAILESVRAMLVEPTPSGTTPLDVVRPATTICAPLSGRGDFEAGRDALAAAARAARGGLRGVVRPAEQLLAKLTAIRRASSR